MKHLLIGAVVFFVVLMLCLLIGWAGGQEFSHRSAELGRFLAGSVLVSLFFGALTAAMSSI